LASIANLCRPMLHLIGAVGIAFLIGPMTANAQTNQFEHDLLKGIESGRVSLRELPGINHYDLVCLASDFPFWGQDLSLYADNCIVRGNAVVFRRTDRSCFTISLDNLSLNVLTGSDWELQCVPNTNGLGLVVTERYGRQHLYFVTPGD
jgi:hypothetical protein